MEFGKKLNMNMRPFGKKAMHFKKIGLKVHAFNESVKNNSKDMKNKIEKEDMP